MRELNIRSRVTLLLLVTTGVLGAASAWVLSDLKGTVQAVGSIYRDRVVPVQQLRAVETAYRRGVADPLSQFVQGSLSAPAVAQRFDAAAGDVQRQWGGYKATELVPQERTLIADVEQRMATVAQVMSEAREAVARNDASAVVALMRGRLEPALSQLDGLFDQLIDLQLTVARAESDRASGLYARAVLTVGGLTVLALLCGGAAAASVLAKHRREQSAADARTARMNEVYRALSRTNQLIVRGPDEHALFDELCRICVDTGLARLASVHRADATAVIRVASAGPAEVLYSPIGQPIVLGDPSAPYSAVAFALRGETTIFNDYLNDPRTAPFHERARAAGIRSMIALPLRRGGQVVASLTLGSTEPGFFDSTLTGLTTEMAGDVSFALDRLDRDEEIRSLNQHLEARVGERTAQLQSAVTELERARDVSEAATHAKGEFLAHMSHEIRTPINAVIGLTDLVLRMPLDTRQRDYLSKAQLAADALLQLVDHILDFSKIEARRLELEARPFGLRELLDQVAAIVAQKAQLKGLAFAVRVGPGIGVPLVGDEQRLRQVLINLCNNAVKFTASGEVVLEVALLDTVDEATRCRLRFSVRDTGIGLSEEQIGRLFQPFVQADASTTRRFGGTGLGLAISKQLVELMGGALEVSSTPGQGSEFGFEVGFALAGAADAGLAGARRDAMAAGSALQALTGRHALLVEDNELNQLVAGDLLREVAGMDVTIADSGERALQALEQRRFDVVLCDVQMPGMDGFELTRRIRAQAPWVGLPIVAVTAHASARDRELCLAAGMDDYLTKPFDPQQLFRVLANAIATTTAPAGTSSGGAANGQAAAPDAASVRAVAPRGGVLFQLGLERCLGLDSLYEKIVRRYLSDGADLPERLASALADGQAVLASRIAHNLVSTAGTLGAMLLSDLARDLQLAIDGRRADLWPPIEQALVREYRIVGDALAAYLAARSTGRVEAPA